MKISPFKLGLVLVVVGMVWTAFIFDETEKKYDSIVLKESSSFEVKSEFSGIDIGYYKLYKLPHCATIEVLHRVTLKPYYLLNLV